MECFLSPIPTPEDHEEDKNAPSHHSLFNITLEVLAISIWPKKQRKEGRQEGRNEREGEMEEGRMEGRKTEREREKTKEKKDLQITH